MDDYGHIIPQERLISINMDQEEEHKTSSDTNAKESQDLAQGEGLIPQGEITWHNASLPDHAKQRLYIQRMPRQLNQSRLSRRGAITHCTTTYLCIVIFQTPH